MIIEVLTPKGERKVFTQSANHSTTGIAYTIGDLNCLLESYTRKDGYIVKVK